MDALTPLLYSQRPKIVQLVPFHSTAEPGIGDRTGGFGSTDEPAVLWTTQASKDKPLSPWLVKSWQLLGLVDTRVDVTIIESNEWPSEWPLKDPNYAIVGGRGLQQLKQSGLLQATTSG